MSATIRPGRTADLAAILEIYNHYVEHTVVTFDLAPATAASRRDWIDGFDDDRHPLFVLEDGGRLLGYAYAGTLRTRPAYDRSVETTIYLAPDATGTGHGRRLYGHLLTHLEGTDVHRAYGGITDPNPASVALHEALGFRQVGRFSECGRKFDQWWDVLWLERSFPLGS